MKSKEYIKQLAVKTIQTEAKSVEKLAGYVTDDFAEVVSLIYQSKGRVVVTGIGKSANIAQKIVATLNSTGTPSIFMHAADAIHGDLGIVQKEDIIICLSKSGNTPEIKMLVPLIKNLGNIIVAVVSNIQSFLAKQADYILQATVDKEACPNNLAPTASTTAQLVMGDALAICLLDCRGFSPQDFARFHPGGSLGKKLYTRISDIYTQNNVPKVSLHDNIRTVIMEISSNRLGATAVLDEENNLSGIITDGDLRRMLEKNESIENLNAEDIMTRAPKVINPDELAINAFRLMEDNNITQLVVAKNNTYLGMIHMHDILKEGIV